MVTKKKNIPEISTEILHFQTREWIRKNGNYREELRLLNEIISDKLVNNTTEGQDHRKIYRNIYYTLVKLSEEMKTSLSVRERLIFEAIGKPTEVAKNRYVNDRVTYLRKLSALSSGIGKLKRSIVKYLDDNPYEGVNEIFPDY